MNTSTTLPNESLILTPEETALLDRMQTGGRSNRKGAQYEKFFAIHQFLHHTRSLLRLGSNIQQMQELIFSNCERAAVDDLCVISLVNNSRQSYQLKDSSTTGKWKHDLRERFELQTKIDSQIHRCNSFWHTLVCSNEAVADRNHSQMQREDARYHSLYYPSHTTAAEMLNDDQTRLREFLRPVCPDVKQHHTALAYIGAVYTENTDFRKSLGDWWSAVIKLARPNIFFISQADIPPEISTLLRKYNFSVSSDSISYHGFSFTLTAELLANLKNPEKQAKLYRCTSGIELVDILLQYSALA